VVPPRLQGIFQDTLLLGLGVWLIATPLDPTLVPDGAFLVVAQSKLLCLPAGAAHVCGVLCTPN
jgi:hypothetical protein